MATRHRHGGRIEPDSSDRQRFQLAHGKGRNSRLGGRRDPRRKIARVEGVDPARPVLRRLASCQRLLFLVREAEPSIATATHAVAVEFMFRAPGRDRLHYDRPEIAARPANGVVRLGVNRDRTRFLLAIGEIRRDGGAGGARLGPEIGHIRGRGSIRANDEHGDGHADARRALGRFAHGLSLGQDERIGRSTMYASFGGLGTVVGGERPLAIRQTVNNRAPSAFDQQLLAAGARRVSTMFHTQ